MHLRRSCATLVVLTCALLAVSASAQSDRIIGPIDHYRTVPVLGHLEPLARAEFDRGAVAPDFALRGMTLLIRRTAAQQQDLNQLLAAQQNPLSPLFHQWLTPEQFADRFGASPHDIETLRQWLESQGFQIRAVARGRMFIRFDGTIQQVRSAFGTGMHYYSVNGVRHYANTGEPMLPANLAPLVLAIRGLDDFGPHPHFVKFPLRQAATPGYTFGAGYHALAPGDLYTIYDVTASYGWGWKGAGETIVVIDASDITASDLALYRTTFGLSSTTLQVVHPDADPGITTDGWATEATMDLELASAMAPSAQLVLDADANVWNAMLDAVDNYRGQIVSMSFGACELEVSSSTADSYQAAGLQANAEGITLIASSGDSGGAGCDADGSSVPVPQTPGASVQLPASLPQVTALGGTEFNEGIGSYWGSTNGSTGGSATGYIPEVVWNDIGALNALYAGGGGVSKFFTKPGWQSGTGVPSDGYRDVPDVSLAASASHDGYVIAINGSLSTAGNSPWAVGGTSASAPLFAGIVAVLNSGVYDDSSGNINSILYAIAAGSNGSKAFHDITSGDNRVAWSGGFYGYYATAGYDLATGLGSVDVAQLNKEWASFTTAPGISSVSPSTATPGSGNALPITVSGTRFQSGDFVQWTFGSETTTLASTYVNSSSMTATVPASLLQGGGTAHIQVVNGSGLYSNPYSFTLTAATIASLSPTSASVNGKAFTLTVNGTGFVSSATIMWNSTPVTTTFASATKLTGAVTQAMLASAGEVAITVVDGNEGTSAASYFDIQAVTPTITSLSPNSAAAGGNGFTLTVTGTNYSQQSTVMWGSTPLTTTYSSATKLTAAVTSSQLAAAGAVHVTVEDQMTSSASTFTVDGPAITALNPKTIAAGAPNTTLTVTGTSFVPGTSAGSVPYIGTTPLTVTAATATSITATLPSSLLSSAGTLSVTVQNPNDSATSSASSLTVAAPVITTLNPKTIAAGAPSTTLTITGTNFVPGTTAGSVPYIGTTALTVTSASATSIVATIPSSLLSSAGSLSVTVQNPNASATSSPSSLSVAAPVITTLNPKTIAAGAPSTTLTVTGTNFVPGTTAGSVPYVGTTALTVTSASATSIVATIPSSLLSSAGPLSVTVQNPNASATSTASSITVAAPIITALSPKTIAAGASSTTLTVTGTNFVPGTSAGSVVYIGTTALTVTAATATSITATIPSSLLSSVGALSVTVQNPSDSATSTAASITVAAPTITTLTPKTIAAGASATTLTVTGTNFIPGTTAGSVVYIGTTALTVTAATATSITATIPSSLLSSVGTLSVTVQNPNDSATSTASSITLAAPTITALNPKTIAAGASATTLTVTGTNFVPGTSAGSVVYVGTTALTVTAATATSITATIPSTLLSSVGTLSVTVQNPSDSATSTASNLTVAAPAITALTPKTITAGASATTLTVTGTNFVPGTSAGSVVYIGTTALTVTAASATSITATIPSSLLSSAGDLSVTVQNPNDDAASSAFTLPVVSH
ncbi:MAG: IPT/TIG domain-containing protein [Bryobacteraceae bacterium]